MIKVTASLCSWKRPQEIEDIKKYLGKFYWIDEILVWDNTQGENIFTYGHLKNALIAKNDIIYSQDDDCIINNIQELYDNFDGTKMIVGMKANRFEEYSKFDSMMGWGAFWDRAWIKVLDKYIAKYGEDYILKREIERIFTALMDKKVMVADVFEYPSAIANFALHKQNDHEEAKRIAIDRCHLLVS